MGGYLIAEAPTGNTIYGWLQSMTTGQIWNGSGMEAYNQSHVGNYSVAMSEQSGSGRYILVVPGGLPNDNYWFSPYMETVSPGTPALGDTPLDLVRFGWLNGNIIDLASALNVGAINGVAQAAANLAISAAQFVSGVAAAGTLTTTSMTTNLGATVANIYAGRVLYFTTGVNAGLAVLITQYQVTGGKLTFVAFNNQPAPSAPSASDQFLII